MIDRWPVLIGLAVGLLVLAGGAFAIGRATAPNTSANAPPAVTPAAVKTINGLQVGVLHTRGGAIAAADNYVASSAETEVQDPPRYEQLVRQVYAPEYQRMALREGIQARQMAPQSVELYAAGGKYVGVVAARRLDSYDGLRASTTAWFAGVAWGPGRVPGHTWSLVETTLRWAGDRWRVEKLDVAKRAAPSPRRLGYTSKDDLKTSTFDRELRGMTAPIYGGAVR